MDLKDQAKLNRISQICSDIAQVAFASLVIPFLIDKSIQFRGCNIGTSNGYNFLVFKYTFGKLNL